MQREVHRLVHREGRCVAWIGLMLCCLMFVVPVSAQVPPLIHYQGSLLDGDFPASDTTLSMQFAFFDRETGGTSLWTEGRPEVAVERGRFSVLLGGRNSFPDALFENEDELYLQVEVEGQVLPRLRMTSTAYALRASTADAVSEGAIDTEALADGAVETSKLAGAAVTSEHIADNTITSSDLAGGSVGTGQLGNESVTNSKIRDGAVTSSKLGDASVNTGKLVNGAVTSVKLAAGTPSEGDYLRYIDGGLAWDDGDDFDFSSRRWKEAIETLEEPMALVEALRGVRYRWTESGEPDVGVIAEEVAEVLPELVTFDEADRPSSVHYGKLVSVLIEAVKQQEREAEAWRRKVEALSQRVEALEQQMNQASEAPDQR